MKFHLEATAEFASNFMVAVGQGTHLETERVTCGAKALDAKNARTVDESLRPSGIGAECGSGCLDGGEGLFQ